MPQTLGDVARKLIQGQRIRIAHYDPGIPKESRIYSATLTDAQMLAYWERLIFSMEPSKNNKRVLLVTLIHPKDYKNLLSDLSGQCGKE